MGASVLLLLLGASVLGSLMLEAPIRAGLVGFVGGWDMQGLCDLGVWWLGGYIVGFWLCGKS